MKKVLICPGIYNSGAQHWQTLWEENYPNLHRVPQHDWDHPVCAEWVDSLEHAVREAGSEVVLVAHSLGCLMVAHWAEQTHLAIKGALLVAPPDPDGANFPSDAKGFAPLPTKPFNFNSIMVYSTNDPYSTPTYTQHMGERWGCKTLVNLGDKGHINAESGLGDWPEGFELLTQLIQA